MEGERRLPSRSAARLSRLITMRKLIDERGQFLCKKCPQGSEYHPRAEMVLHNRNRNGIAYICKSCANRRRGNGLLHFVGVVIKTTNNRRCTVISWKGQLQDAEIDMANGPIGNGEIVNVRITGKPETRRAVAKVSAQFACDALTLYQVRAALDQAERHLSGK